MGAPTMDALPPPTEEEQAQLMALLQAYEQGMIGANDVPPDLKELLVNVQRVKGQPTEVVDAEEVIPQPCFVVKTSDKPTGRKVFVNICSSDVVPPPSGWERGASMPEQVSAALDRMQSEMSSQDAEALRFPLSCGDLRPETDKSGSPCLVVDCIFNADVAAAAGHNRPLQAFLVELALGWVSDKHKLELDQRFKLPKMAYKGSEVAPQRVRKPRAPLVTEVTGVTEVTASDEAPSFALPLAGASGRGGSGGRDGSSRDSSSRDGKGPAASASSSKGAVRVTEVAPKTQGYGQKGSAAGTAGATATAGAAAKSGPALQHSIECEGRPVTALRVTVQLPPGFSNAGFSTPDTTPSPSGRSAAVEGRASGSKVHVHVSGQQLSVAVPGCQPLKLQLPFAATATGATAVVADDRRCLLLRLPYLPLQHLVGRMEQQRPHSYGELGLHADSYLELEP